MRVEVFELAVETSAGTFSARYSENGLCGLRFPTSTNSGGSDSVEMSLLPEHVRQWHRLTTAALGRVFEGHEPGRLPPFDLSEGTEFQQRVWAAMSRIPYGETLSYSEVASAIGNPKAVRAVGGACGANPIPVFVPCHRVLAAHKRLGGFSGGLEWKRKLLELEGKG